MRLYSSRRRYMFVYPTTPRMVPSRCSGYAARWWRILLCGSTFVTMAASPVQRGDPTAGKQIFMSVCNTCHSAKPGQNYVGPSLFGVIGRPSASEQGYNYSTAFKSAHVTWDVATLDKYLSGPRLMIPGTRMTYPGQPDPAKRANIIAYLQTLK
jgi:cytochrome c